MKKILFIDRDGILIKEPHDEQVDDISKVVFPDRMLSSLATIAHKTSYVLVMVTNQDGLGTAAYPENHFWPIQELLLRSLSSEGVIFDDVCIDRSYAADNSPYRKPNTGMLARYMDGSYDLVNSFVIGDRWSDMQLARNLGCKGIWLNPRKTEKIGHWQDVIALETYHWGEVVDHLLHLDRKAMSIRSTSETSIKGSINLDGSGIADVSTGLSFLDHMLDQICKHAHVDLWLQTQGDLHVDEHHTIEDTAIVLGDLLHNALSRKAGIARYGYALPMDDCMAQVLLDFGGRPWLEWDVSFTREHIGDVPTEMFFHFFKSLSDHAKCNLNITARGQNEHHKIEAIFKGFAKAILMAKQRNTTFQIPSTKGDL